MPEALSSEPVPLETSGVIRVRGTRVTLDTLWAAFQEGATAEEIVQPDPSLSLADTYQTIGYCLRNPALVTGYLVNQSESGTEIRKSGGCRKGFAPDYWNDGRISSVAVAGRREFQ